MGIKDTLKENSNKLLNIASENATKAFDYPKIKSLQIKEAVNLKIREKLYLQQKLDLLKITKVLMITQMNNLK